MANTHAIGDTFQELEAARNDTFAPFVSAGGAPAVPASSLTLDAFTTDAYVSSGGQLRYVSQGSNAVGPLNAGDGTYWIAIHADRTTAVASWNREGLTHYLWRQSATKPATPTSGLIFAMVTVAGGVITAVELDGIRRITTSTAITVNTTYRSTAVLQFEPPGELAVSTSITATINGSVVAPLAQIFSGAGTVAFGEGFVSEVYPQWWGAVADGVTDDTTALQAALTTGHTVILPPGTYITGTLTMTTPGQTFKSSGYREQTILSYNGGDTGAALQLRASFLHLENLYVLGASTLVTATSSGIDMQDCTRSLFTHVRVEGFGYGLFFSGSFGGTLAFGNTFHNCYIFTNVRAGAYIFTTAHGTVFGGSTEIANSAFGIIKGRVREPFDIDYDFIGETGANVVVVGCIIESINEVNNGTINVGGYGVYSSPGSNGVAIYSSYFEDIDNACTRWGSRFQNNGTTEHTSPVESPTIVDSFLSDSAAAFVRAGVSRGGRIVNNHLTGGAPNIIDTSDVASFDRPYIANNVNYTALYSDSLIAAGGHNIRAVEGGPGGRILFVSHNGTTELNAISIDTSIIDISALLNFRVNIGTLLLGSIAILEGTGSPEGVVAQPVGSLFLRSGDGGTSTTLYVKETGGATSTGWVAK